MAAKRPGAAQLSRYEEAQQSIRRHENSLPIHAVEFISRSISDAPTLPERLDQIPPEHEVRGVTAKSACDRLKGRDALQTKAPTRSENAETDHGRSGRSKRTLRASNYLGPPLWRNWGGYHRRSRVETKMHSCETAGARAIVSIQRCVFMSSHYSDSLGKCPHCDCPMRTAGDVELDSVLIARASCWMRSKRWQ